MTVRLIIAAGKIPETFAGFDACAVRLLDMARHPNTQDARDIRVHWGHLSETANPEGQGTRPVAIVRAEDGGGVQSLGYVAADDTDLDAQAIAEAVLAALVVAARVDGVIWRKAAA